MRTDPRAACANAEERTAWAFVHDAVAHPLMALTGWARPSLRFHDWTSFRAWPRVVPASRETVLLSTPTWILCEVTRLGPNLYNVQHPQVQSHSMTTTAADAIEALEKAEVWFNTLAEMHGGLFAPVPF